MKNLFTRFLMIVFLFSVFYQAYGAGSPPIPSVPDISMLWPGDESTTQAQPGTGNVFVLEFSKDLNAIQPFGPDGVFGLVWESDALGYQQIETILYKVDGSARITKVGNRKVEIRFAASLLEDETYHITIEYDAIRFADGSWFGGVDYESLSNPEWRFTVDDITPPKMENCADVNNVNGEFDVDVNQNPITVCFDEPVWWANNADPFKVGNIAFYSAAKSGLDPNTEFGGDVIYEKPANVILYNNNMEVYNSMELKSASVQDDTYIEFDQVEIYPKWEEGYPDELMLKHAPIGNNVWPEDRDIYLRFAAGLLVDKAGNPFGGIDGSPFDPFNPSSESQYWFSTRSDNTIPRTALAVLNTSVLPGSPRGANPLWQNDDIVVKISSDDLEFITDAAITTSNVNQFIKLSIDGGDVSYTVKDIDVLVGETQFLLEPNNLPEFKTLKVDLLGNVIRDNGDLRVVAAATWNFNTGDFSAPAITSSVNNILCTNFDLRIITAKNTNNSAEEGIVYYAIVKDTLPELLKPGYYWPAFPTDITPAEVVKGQVKRVATVGGEKYSFYWHFYHVADGVGYGKTGVNTAVKWTGTSDPGGAPAIVGWIDDNFNINSSLTAFEHIDDFIAANHGDNYNIYFFALDNVCEGPYNNPTGTPLGRATEVTMLDVQLTDCLQPDMTWFYEDIIDDHIDWTECGQDVLDEITGPPVPRIQKDGKFKLDFLTHPEGIQLVESNLDWEDVITLEVREYNGGTWNRSNPWTVEIASIDEIMDGGKVVGLWVTPLNNYPSQGRARVTLASGSIEDAAGNAVNEELICRKNVEIYDDPWVHIFTVENKEQMFPLDENCPDIDTYVAEKDGKITIVFNNPIYTPKRDESNSPVLEPISLDPAAANYVGKYVKLREGDANGAEVTSNLINDGLTFELYGLDGDGDLVLLTAPITQGVTKIVATPKNNYKSENWYYVELEKDLQDENRRELSYVNGLGTWDNNLFVDLHEQYCPYPTAPLTGIPSSWTVQGNMANYFMRFRSEDTVSPELRFVFEKFDDIQEYPDGTSTWPYIEEVNDTTVFCINSEGFEGNGAPVGAIITEWSTMGFDNKDYYIEQDPNGLRPYFKMKDADGKELPFDVVVLRIFEPDAPGMTPYTRDAVWFGFVPFVPLGEGKNFTMEFNPNYQAPQSGQIETLPEGPVFVDDNGNSLVKNTLVHFTTCSEDVICFNSDVTIQTTVIDGKNVVGGFTPSFNVTFDRQFDLNNTPYFTLVETGGGLTLNATDATGFVYNGNTITVPFSTFGVGTKLNEKKEYTLTVVSGGFIDRNSDVVNCTDFVKFWSPDTTAPAPNLLTPDIDNFVLGVDVGNAANVDPTQIDPRNPGLLTIRWNEKVTPQAGKTIEVWENGTTERLSFAYPNANITWTASTNTITVKLPADFFAYYKPQPLGEGHFHVDVEAGFVKDMAGNASLELTGPTDRLTVSGGDGSATWTFQTGSNVAPEIVNWSPKCLVEPGNMSTEPISATEVKINKISVTLSEGVTPVTGLKLYVRKAVGGTDLYVTNVTAMTASADKKTYSITPSPDLIVDNNEEYRIFVEEGAFTESYPLTNKLSTPDYENENFLNCEDSGFDQFVSVPASFAFGDISAPTATIWPENGKIKVPFNAHGYVKFSEKLIARAGFTPGDPQLVLTQSNIKNWIKVLKADADANGNPLGTYSDLDATDYVVEFVNLERTHMRITFLDEDAPAIEGVTANMVDEWKYQIVVNTNANIGGVDYLLQDYIGNFLGMPNGESSGNWLASALVEQEISTYTTEDITVPVFYATTCDVTPGTIKINFTPWENDDPYDNGRIYPAESGKVYYVVRPYGTTVTADNLFNKTWADVKEVVVPSTGATVTWTIADVNLPAGYNYSVYAVMADDETDVYVAPAYGSAWPTSDPVFIASGDADPATGAIGLADIRPAPNKNMDVMKWNFCFCDDDAPKVVTKEWDKQINVPVDETFEIKFNELVQPGTDVTIAGDGTGGTIITPEYGYEVRLREWNNNVAVPITLKGNGTGLLGLTGATGLIVTPVNDLLEETRYYIEMDRWVIWDVANSNCNNNANITLPEGFPESQCLACNSDDFADNTNNFPGWIGREDWWFQTTDNTPPVLTAVSPLGNCVAVDNNKIVFTFTEKNEMVIANLMGQENNVYVYKVGSTVPYEIISAHSAVPVRVLGNTWTITYTTLHPYNSEEEYYVLWNKDLFVDNAIPMKHNYTEMLSEVVDYPENSDWQQFGFTTEDALYPVVSWTFVNRMWVDLASQDDELDPEDYVYALAAGDVDNNDPLSGPVDVCEMYDEQGGVPGEVGFYVWFNENVVLKSVPATPSDTYLRRWINANFWLHSADGTVTLDYLNHGIAYGDVEIPGGVTIPSGSQWFYLKPLSALESLGEYNFGVIGDAISDVNAKDCRYNTLDETQLLNFCVWDETPPTAQLFDGKDVEIEVLIDEADECVAEREYVRLKLSKPLVKTVNVAVLPQFGTPAPFNPWWTFSNLYLTEADLKDTDGQIIRFKNVTTNEYVVVRDVDIITDGVEYKLWLDEPMASENLYEFEIYPDVLKDMVRIPNGNFYPGEEWDWYVTDWIAPYIISLSPGDEDQNVSPVANLSFTFNEDVVPGTDARIIIRDNGIPQGVIYNFRADDAAHVTYLNDHRTVVINHGGLDKNTTYYVQIEPGFVYEENCSNLPFGGKFEQGLINDSWNFTTGDVDGPVATLWPTPGDGCVEIDANLVIRFDENVQLTDNGKVAIYKVREGGSFHNPGWPDAMFGDIVAVIPFTNANDPQVRLSGSNVANGLTSDIITITPSSGLWESDATYYVRIVGDGVDAATEASVVEDVVGNTWMYPPSHASLDTLPGIHQNQWYFTIGNNDEPELVYMTPERGEVVEAGVARATTDLTMTFDDEIKFGEGAIQVWEFIVNPEGGVAAQQANPWMVYNVPGDVENGKISLSNDMKTVTVHDVDLLDGINWYYVLVTPGTITNNIECTLKAWSGISNPDEWLFSTAPDVTDPELAASAVTSDACSETYLEPATVAFELTFSEGVSVANGTGLVEIREVGGDVVASATITPAMIEGGVVTFGISDFDMGLNDQTAYELVIGGDAIHDLATASLTGTQDPFGRVPFGNENWFEGVTIPFETGDFTAPTAIEFTPVENDLENEVTLTVTFDEAVQDGSMGMLHLYDAVADTMVAHFNAANDEDLNPMTVTFTTTLPDEMSYYVLIDEGFVSDSVYMESCDTVRGSNAVTDPAAWTFAIDDNTAPYITEDLTEDTDNLMMTFEIVLQYDDVISMVDVSKATLMLDGYEVTSGVRDAVIGTDPTQVIVSVTVTEDQKEYMIDLAAGFVMDDAINANASEADMTGPYMVGDRTAPVLEDAAPEGILGSYIGVEVMVDFFDDSELTVELPITIENSLGEVVATWTPELDSATQAASFMPELWFDTYTVIIPAGAVVDENGNEFAGASWSFAVIDNIAPQDSCLTIISPADGANCVESDVVLEMEFCERMAAGDTTRLVKVYNILEIGGGLSDNDLFTSFPVTEDMVDGEMVKIPLSGLADNTGYTVMMDAGALTDEAGNDFVGINNPIRWNFTTGDNTAPTVTLMPAGSTNDLNDIVVMATFSEEVVGAEAEITVENAVSYVVEATANPVEYKITIKADDMDTVVVTVPVTITDVNCNYNPLAEEVTGTYVVGDNTAPMVTVTDAPADAMNTMNTFTVELTFSEEVTGVEEALEGSVGLDTVVTADGIVYTLSFSGDDETEGKLELIDSLVTDISLNANQLVRGINWPYMIGDHVIPTVVVEPATGDDLRIDTLDLTITFSEEVIVPDGGIVVTGGQAVIDSISSAVRKLSITAEDGAEVVVSLTSLITDDSKNANALVAAEYTYTFGDRTAPMVTVYKPAATDTIPTFDVTIGFNEQVTGVSAQSVKLTGDGAVITLRTIVEGWAYEASITGAEKGTVVLEFTNAIKDLAGNALVPVNFTYTIGDFTGSVVMADPSSGNFVTNMFEVTLTFDEEVNGVAGAVSVSGGTVAVTGSGMVYTAMIDAPSMSDVNLILGTSIMDLAGNAFAGATFTYSVTGLVPISAVQSNASESAHKGKVLQVEATVTAVAAGEGFFVQDAVAAWSGIWVEYAKVNDDDIKVGDGVLVTGEVAEVADVTTIIASNVMAQETAMAITPIEVTPTGAEAEMYESVLVKVNGARATSADAGSGEWTIYYATTDNITVNDWMYQAVPVVDHFFDVTGIVNGRLDAFKLEPRMESDVVDKTLTDIEPLPAIAYKVYPNPFNDYIQIDNNDKLVRLVILNIAGQRVIDIEYPENRIRTANLVSGVYLVNLFTEDGIVKTERIIKR